MNLKLQAHEVGQDGRRAGLCSDGRDFVVWSLGPDNGKTVASKREKKVSSTVHHIFFPWRGGFALRHKVWACEEWSSQQLVGFLGADYVN